jgi:uncharacterized protein YciI
MLISIYCKDASGSAEVRQSRINEHLHHIELIMDKLKVAGPLMNNENSQVVGSLLIFELDSLAEAQVLIESDPYFEAGIWSEIRVEPFLGVAGEWVGGKSW